MFKYDISRSVWTDPRYFLAFGFGAGLSPLMPGTMGTLMAIPFYLLLSNLAAPWYLVFVAVAFFIGVVVCDYCEKSIGQKDYQGIVWDELVGFWVTMFLVPTTWLWILLGFVSFRIFDIIKPWPIGWLNKNLHGGLGIMFDDVVAGIAASLVLHFFMRFFS